MEKSYKNCQSYGMPLKRNAQGGSSNRVPYGIFTRNNPQLERWIMK